MTKAVDERRRGRAEAMPSEAQHNMMLQLHMHDDPETWRHQALAQIVYEGRRKPEDPPWSKLPRKDRVPSYGLTDGLV